MEKPQEHNLKVYEDGKVVSSYTRTTDLSSVEKIIIDKLRSEIKEGDRILDLGVGTGRTTPFLKSLSSNYIGADYSSAMIQSAKKSSPGTKFSVEDARDLRNYKDEEFDLVFFSFNGLDYINHNDRLKALKEIARVLKKGRPFVFSTHNIHYKYFDQLRLTYTGNLPRWVLYSLRKVYNRMKNMKDHVYSDNYAVVTDPGHGYRLLTYYTSSEGQMKQLADAGFGVTTIYDLQGKVISKSEDCPECSWLYYKARK